MARSDDVFMEKRSTEDFRDWEMWGRYFCIWRCQNRYEGANDWGNTVERQIDGLYGLERLRFCGLLRFQLDFQLQFPVVALKSGFLKRDARFFLRRSGTMVVPG